MIKLSRLLLLSVLITISSNGFAFSDFGDQKFVVPANGTVIAVISKREITRISFEDEIVNLNSLKDELEYNIQERDIYIKPLVDKPINFFLTTRAGITYKVIVTIEDIPATQIFIASDKTDTIAIGAIKQDLINHQAHLAEDLKARITKIINIALKPRKYLGYKITKLNKSLFSSNKNLSMQLVEMISGKKLIAEKIYLTNKSNNPYYLNLEEFINKDLLATYLSKEALLPSETCILIRIIES